MKARHAHAGLACWEPRLGNSQVATGHHRIDCGEGIRRSIKPIERVGEKIGLASPLMQSRPRANPVSVCQPNG